MKNTYDKNGNKLTMTDATGTTGRIYDAMNRCIVKSVPNIGATTFDYDILSGSGTCKEVTTDPKGNVSAKVYDKLGRIVAVEDAGIVKATYEYYENGLKKSVSYPQNAVTESYAYSPYGQLETLTNIKGGATLFTYTYAYDPAGNQISKTETKDGNLASQMVTMYQYDRLNQLLKATEPGTIVTEYTYDQAGNRRTEARTENGATKLLSYGYNEQNRLTSTYEDIGTTKQTTEYIYDNNGNLLYSKKQQLALITDPKNIPPASFSMFVLGQTTEEENPFVAWMSSYEYDEFNQMIKSVTKAGTIENKYNGEGLRTEKTLNDELIRFLYIEDQPVLEVDKNGMETARNILGTNLVSRVVDRASELYYLYNGHADVTELITPQGTIAAEYTYDAFGVPKTTTGTADNPFRYAGYQYDESGLYYLKSRMYNPVIARFMQEDTYRGELNDPLSLNLYAYCNNNPLIYSDPDGYRAVSKHKIKAAKAAAAAAKAAAAKAAKSSSSKKSSSSNSSSSNKKSSSNSNNNSSSSSTCPTWLDWNGDGKVDSSSERKSYDANHDAKADWLQEDTKTEWAYAPTTGWVKPTNDVIPNNVYAMGPQEETYYLAPPLSLSRINQIEKKGKSTAKQYLSDILDTFYNYWDTPLRKSFTLEDYTFYEQYLEIYNKARTAEEETKAVFEKLGIFVTYIKYLGELNEMNGVYYLPYNAVYALAFTGIDVKLNQEAGIPGVENVPDMFGYYAKLRKEKDIAYEQLNYIANSDYRYFVSSVVKDDYIELISYAQESLKKNPRNGYGNNSEEKDLYNQSIYSYLNSIKNMHKNYRQSYEYLTTKLNDIERKYR